MSIEIEGEGLFIVKGKGGKEVVELVFQASSGFMANHTDRWALFVFQEDADADTLTSVEEVLRKAIAGARSSKDRVKRIGRRSLLTGSYGSDSAKAEDLLSGRKVKTTIEIIKRNANLKSFTVQLSAEVGEKKPRILQIPMQGEVPDDLFKVQISGMATRVSTDSLDVIDREKEFESLR
jgi:hypothetical protein